MRAPENKRYQGRYSRLLTLRSDNVAIVFLLGCG